MRRKRFEVRATSNSRNRSACRGTRGRWVLTAVIGLFMSGTAAACNNSVLTTPKGVIPAIGVENEYANVLSQIGGKYVRVLSILNNPNTDPHTYEASPRIAQEVSTARLIVQNGVGYDAFVDKIESATRTSGRRVIVAQDVLGLPDDTPNPHLWYSPTTMPEVARAIATALDGLQPSHRSYFEANLQKFNSSLDPWIATIRTFKTEHEGAPVATTEPVADYLLDALGTKDLTPFNFQADIMNGVDPAPEDVSLEDGFFTEHLVKVFVYNEQVVDSLTTSIRQKAISAGIPVVGVYETMPTGYTYQSWMIAETQAVERAVTDGTSTEHL